MYLLLFVELFLIFDLHAYQQLLQCRGKALSFNFLRSIKVLAPYSWVASLSAMRFMPMMCAVHGRWLLEDFSRLQVRCTVWCYFSLGSLRSKTVLNMWCSWLYTTFPSIKGSQMHNKPKLIHHLKSQTWCTDWFLEFLTHNIISLTNAPIHVIQASTFSRCIYDGIVV